MTNKKDKTVYRSFEQLRAELFPELVERERMNELNKDPDKFGAYLADKSFNAITGSDKTTLGE